MLLMLYILSAYITSFFVVSIKAPPGYMLMMMVLLLLGTGIMLSLGVIGEYLGRLFLEIKKRPQPVLSVLINDHRKSPRAWLGRCGTPPTQPHSWRADKGS